MNKQLLLVISVLTILLSSCNKQPQLKVKGSISNAIDKTLYFELFDMDTIRILDSTVLDKKGLFQFKTKLPDVPEFYRLRIENKVIYLAADSAVNITIQENASNFGKSYQVEGSEICNEIKYLSDIQGETIAKIDELTHQLQSNLLKDQDYQEKVSSLLNKQREEAKRIIYKKIGSPAAYFALFQRTHNALIFNPYNAEDSRVFAGVATFWDTFYPNSPRSIQLKALTLQGIKAIRNNKNTPVKIIEKNADTSFEITLPNMNGKEISLSAFKGKVVLLDFTALKGRFSSAHNLFLRALHSKYAKRGFEIYQISYDPDEEFWKTSSKNLPWVSVRDKNLLESEYLQTFRIETLPTFFLFDRKGELYLRESSIKDVNKEIQRLL